MDFWKETTVEHAQKFSVKWVERHEVLREKSTTFKGLNQTNVFCHVPKRSNDKLENIGKVPIFIEGNRG